MTADGGGFAVEEFINAITAQLDRVQDALRLKAVNRPLTYALKELSLELKVFVEMDGEGNVRMRPGGPNESGTSEVHLSFTTITKPMIEENTISLTAARSAPLDELGLTTQERRRLEHMGVRNIAQLDRLGASTGVTTVSRLSAVPVDRLRQMLSAGRPRLSGIRPQSPKPAAPPTPPVVKVPPGTRRLQLKGAHLVGDSGPPTVRLNKKALALSEADDDVLVVEMPEPACGGHLEVGLPDGQVVAYELSVDDGAREGPGHDLWAPDGGGE